MNAPPLHCSQCDGSGSATFRLVAPFGLSDETPAESRECPDCRGTGHVQCACCGEWNAAHRTDRNVTLCDACVCHECFGDGYVIRDIEGAASPCLCEGCEGTGLADTTPPPAVADTEPAPAMTEAAS